MAFHFVAVIAVGQCDAGNERAQGRRQAHQRHERGNADHQCQRKHHKHFMDMVFADEAEHQGHDIAHRHDNHGNGGNADQRHHPTGLMFKQIDTGMTGGRCIFGMGRCGQQRQQGQHGNGGNVLKQQNGKTRLPPLRGQ